MDAEIATVIGHIDEEREAAGQSPFRMLSREICNVPGIRLQSAGMILAEIGLDMSHFATAGHIVAWTGLCPGQNESGGKRKPARLRKGAPWLKATLAQCAISASKKKGSYFQAQFQRLKSRRGAPKSTCAVAASLLTTIYHMLKDGTSYCEFGAGHFDKRRAQVKVNRLVAQLAN